MYAKYTIIFHLRIIGYVHVTFIAPVLAPRVPNDEVIDVEIVWVLVLSIADNEHGMVRCDFVRAT